MKVYIVLHTYNDENNKFRCHPYFRSHDSEIKCLLVLYANNLKINETSA